MSSSAAGKRIDDDASTEQDAAAPPEAKSGPEESPLPEQHDAVARDPEVKNLVWAWLADEFAGTQASHSGSEAAVPATGESSTREIKTLFGKPFDPFQQPRAPGGHGGGLGRSGELLVNMRRCAPWGATGSANYVKRD